MPQPPLPPVYIGYPPPTDSTMAQFTTHTFLHHHRAHPDSSSILQPPGSESLCFPD